ncbi:DUF4062 domain-containing protein [Exiguobacterium sp. s91]|uniref:DUF4062 domain-containing protein n=1 Tax=Exiguobacterium sp. s91 TaxID=2751199 RepID=UPI001BE80D13|nr:DUF4062 domain-containing protein [Exiguobacterium sp. s91]
MRCVRLIKIFIASPGDVSIQRDKIEKLIWGWNNEHADTKNVILMPIRWENNSSASYETNKDGQAVINEQIVKDSDILIALFGNRIGTRTKNGKSGTIEEIDVFYNHHKRNVGIFFLEIDTPESLIEERKMVMKYKEYLINNNRGLFEKYSDQKILYFITKQVDALIKSLVTIENENFKKNENNVFHQDIFDESEYDIDEQLFCLFMVEEELRTFGARWMAKDTIVHIKRWEDDNNLENRLSSNYEKTLNKMFQRDALKVEEITEYNNPRLYSITKDNYLDAKKYIQNNNEKAKKLKLSFRKS